MNTESRSDTTQAGSGEITPAAAHRSTSQVHLSGEGAAVVEPSRLASSPAETVADEIMLEELFQFDIPGLAAPTLPAVMIDIETLDNTPTAAIASIGAVRFDPHGHRIGENFHVHVDLEDCQRHGLTIGASTVLWWLKQSAAARDALANGQTMAAPLITALEALHAFLRGDDGGPGEIWCNGNSFDFPILAHAYRAVGWKQPWKFYNERDLRTLKGIYPATRVERDGLAHHALDDAIHQARLVQRIMQTNLDIDS